MPIAAVSCIVILVNRFCADSHSNKKLNPHKNGLPRMVQQKINNYVHALYIYFVLIRFANEY